MAELDRYPTDRAHAYQQHHSRTLRHRLTSSREQACLARALRDAGTPRRVLDLACGTGRFWPVFARSGVAEVIAADASPGMLAEAEANRQGPMIPSRIVLSSAFALPLDTDEVDFVSCMRFYHHLARPEDRHRVLGELARVCSGHVALSLWVDGNYGSFRRSRKPRPVPRSGFGHRICRQRAEVEAEFASAGFRIVGHYDVWPRISMWRLYLLAVPG
ncbi:MAG: class I SAM-dependent methyltransferase [Pseudomonadales bacterium]